MGNLQLAPLLTLLAVGLAAKEGYAQDNSTFTSPSIACDFFHQNYPNITYLSDTNDTTYNELNTDYWSAAASLGPACIFAPTSSELMGIAIQKLEEYYVPFAIRGGGHMAIPGYNNIGSSGVLLSSSGLTQLELSEDRSTIAVGSGNRWGDVFNYLQPYGLAVVGGRMSVVGVPGLILGGGISNFGNELGWASSNIESYTCVLATGEVVVANATNEYADLYWALRGGGNSFCIVTNFQMRTIAVPVMTAGQRTYGAGVDVGKQFLDSVYEMATQEKPDVKGAVTPIARLGTGIPETTYNAMLFYNGNDTEPAFFSNFSEPVMTPENDTFQVLAGMGAASSAMSEGIEQVAGFREGWWVLSISADREAMSIINDTYFETASQYFANTSTWITGLAWNIISKDFVLGGLKAGGSDPMGLDPEKAPYFWVEESLTWKDEADDAVVEAFYEDVNAKILQRLEGMDVVQPFLYMNDVNKNQDVFGGYPESNVQQLKEIRNKYDSDLIFTKLMPGGFKVFDA